MTEIKSLINYYQSHILNRITFLINASKQISNLTNNELALIFEYYTAIHLMKQYNQLFLIYSDIDPNFKELNQLSKVDKGK
jgi:hypothetical protein